MTITLNPFRLLDRPRKPDPAPGPFAGYRRDPFKAVPVLNELAEVREDSHACYQIRLRLKPRKGMASFVANRLGFHRDVRVDLDARGTFYWSQVDGRRDLRCIEKKMRKKFGLEADESRKATLLFTKMLMLRHLVQLDVRDRDEAENKHEAETAHHA